MDSSEISLLDDKELRVELMLRLLGDLESSSETIQEIILDAIVKRGSELSKLELQACLDSLSPRCAEDIHIAFLVSLLTLGYYFVNRDMEDPADSSRAAAIAWLIMNRPYDAILQRQYCVDLRSSGRDVVEACWVSILEHFSSVPRIVENAKAFQHQSGSNQMGQA